MKLKLKLTTVGTVYFPYAAQEILGADRDERGKIINRRILPVEAIANAKSILVFPNNANLKDVLESMNIIRQDIELRLKGEEVELSESGNEIKIEDDKVIFRNSEKTLYIPAPNIKILLTKMPKDDVAVMIQKRLLDRGFDIKLMEIKKVLIKLGG